MFLEWWWVGEGGMGGEGGFCCWVAEEVGEELEEFGAGERDRHV